MEVYVNDMLMKSLDRADHVKHLEKAFALLRKFLQKFSVKLNPEKCTFRVAFGKFLKYLVTQRGIEANPDQILDIL